MSGKIWNNLFTAHGIVQHLSVDHANKEFVYRVFNPQLRYPVVDSNGNQRMDIVCKSENTDTCTSISSDTQRAETESQIRTVRYS